MAVAAPRQIAYRRLAMTRNIVIYRDEGAGEFGLRCLEKFFAGDDVWFCTAESVIDGRVLGMADVFVMPGGADLPYCKKLNGAGNDNIRAYVEEGGTYLGICAGAYYGCRRVEFHKGREDEICGNRELAFADCIAVGSLSGIAPFYDETLNSAAIANIVLADGGRAQCFYNGGCRFDLPNNSPAEILARYEDLPDAPPAIIRTQVGEGFAILSGIHFEITPALLPQHPSDGERQKLDALLTAFKAPFPFDKALAA